MGEIIPEQTRRNEKNSEEAINYEILPVTMVDRQRKFFISNRLKRLEKLNICRGQVIQISIINRCLLQNYLESVLKAFKFLGSFEV